MEEIRRRGRIIRTVPPAPSGRGGELETELTVKIEEVSIRYKVLVLPDEEGRYREIVLVDDKGNRISKVKTGAWSDWIRVRVREKIGIFCFKLLELSDDRRTLSILQTQVSPKITDAIRPSPE